MKTKSTDTVRNWKAKLDILFAHYIKKRDSINGRGQCVTCGEIFSVGDLDAGHFRSRKHSSTRYDERNVALQCKKCNRFSSGEQWEFGKYLDDKYGDGTALELTRKSHEIKKFTVSELKDLYSFYKFKVENMEEK